jgi:hypothetical protein
MRRDVQLPRDQILGRAGLGKIRGLVETPRDIDNTP